VPLGVTLSLTLRNDVQKKQTANVIGKLPGRDPDPGQGGRPLHRAPRPSRHARGGQAGEDVIYNGARDNASGVAAVLAIARAMKALPQAPAARSCSRRWRARSRACSARVPGRAPAVPIGAPAANINIDELGIWGRTRDMIMIGKGKSTLDTVVEAIAAAQGRRPHRGRPEPRQGVFLSLRPVQPGQARRARGLPRVRRRGRGQAAGWGAAQHAKYEETDYHQPSDELRPDWDFSGAVEDTQLLFYLGVKVAEGKNMPSWNPGDEFEGARKQRSRNRLAARRRRL
jgi:hypothetical protein